MKKISILFLGLIVLGLAACTIEKRHFMKGYHVEWKHGSPEIGGEGKTTHQENTANLDETQELNGVVDAPENLVEVAPAVQQPVLKANTEKAVVPNETKSKVVVKKSSNVLKDVTAIGSYSASGDVQVGESTTVSESKAKKDFNYDTVLLVILAILLPPLAMYLYEGETWTSRCTLNLILTLLCGLPGVIHALVVILGGK
ncbi:MAG: YqaE/Pmp3 family membrane protein [Flavobacteriales bacterium]|jgi:uncharacterized membrane protein YqaE (UPF0057 family)